MWNCYKKNNNIHLYIWLLSHAILKMLNKDKDVRILSERSLLHSPRLHLFHCKNSNIVKYFYNLK